jgi:divalent metal cation (Fe/Co/Zn/Cd) transporter
MDVWTIVSAALGLISVIAGGYYLKVKGKLNQFKTVVSEGYDVIQAAVDAIEDDKIDKAEVEKIKQEAAEFKAAIKLLFAKEG